VKKQGIGIREQGIENSREQRTAGNRERRLEILEPFAKIGLRRAILSIDH